MNEHDEKINKWYYYDVYGQLSKVEEFILSGKKNPVEQADVGGQRIQRQLPFAYGK